MLEVRDLTISFRSEDGEVPALRSVSFRVSEGKPWQSWGKVEAERV
jgi:ABC-type glutathione transport system ATPase component